MAALAACLAGAEPVVVLDVPFVAQTPELCGGAAAAMVLRYWGVKDVQAADFAALVDPDRDGIPTRALREELERRGFQAFAFPGDGESVGGHLASGRPVIALIEVAPGQHHYVVLVAWSHGRVLFHDPAMGAFRLSRERDLLASWSPTGYWALLALPGPGALPEDDAPAPGPGPRAPGGCDGLVAAGVEEARGGRLEAAELRLAAAAALCAEEPLPLRELAGLRFREERFAEAAELAGRAAALDPGDDHAWRVLGTSRFLAGDARSALDAWNRVGEPRLDATLLTGLRRVRRDVVEAQLGIAPRELLTRDALELSSRRLAAVPALQSVRVSYRPLGEGRARLDAAVLERRLVGAWPWWLASAAADAGLDREVGLALSSPTGAGERVDLVGRFWQGRPAARAEVRAPGALGLPGITGVALLWERETHVGDRIEERLGGRLSSAQWWTPGLRVEWRLGLDEWNDRASPFFGLELEQRLAEDRVALIADGTAWRNGSETFSAWSLRVAARRSARPGRFRLRGRVGLYGASRRAPLRLWPGAGVGHVREPLLRAHRLLVDDEVAGVGFGRELLNGNAEAGGRILELGPISAALVGFVDVARVWDRPGETRAAPPFLVDAGGGLRLSLPGLRGELRLDAATPLNDGHGVVVSAAVSSEF